MSELKRDLKAGVAPRSLLTKVGEGLYLGPVHEKNKSAYETYFERNPKDKKEALGAPIDEKVIDFIVESFEVESIKPDFDIKPFLKKELKLLNKKSKTGRILTKQLIFGQEIKLFDEDDMALARVSVGPNKREIYLNKKMVEEVLNSNLKTVSDLSLSLLHETGHLLEDKMIMPLFDAQKGFYNQQGNPISTYYFNMGPKYLLRTYHLFEAEKLMQEIAIRSELMSVTGIFKCFLKGIASEFLAGVSISKKAEKELQHDKELSLAYYKLSYWKTFLSSFLKDPLSLFSRKKREEKIQTVLLKTMGSHLKFLTQPFSKRKPKGFLKLLPFPIIQKNNDRILSRSWYQSNFLFLDGVINLMLGLGFLGISPLIYASCFFLSGFCFATDIGLKINNSFQRAINRRKKFWAYLYRKNEQRALRGFSIYRIGGKKKFQEFSKAFSYKYQNEITEQEICQIKSLYHEVESDIQVKKNILKLTKKEQSDIFCLSLLRSLYTNKEYEECDAEFWGMDFLKSVLRWQKDKKEPLSFSQAVKEYIFYEINKRHHYDISAKLAHEEILNEIKSKEIKQALLARKEAFQNQSEEAFIKENGPVVIKKAEEAKWVEVIQKEKEKKRQKH